jgi:hypothetical protein
MDHDKPGKDPLAPFDRSAQQPPSRSSQAYGSVAPAQSSQSFGPVASASTMPPPRTWDDPHDDNSGRLPLNVSVEEFRAPGVLPSRFEFRPGQPLENGHTVNAAGAAPGTSAQNSFAPEIPMGPVESGCTCKVVHDGAGATIMLTIILGCSGRSRRGGSTRRRPTSVWMATQLRQVTARGSNTSTGTRERRSMLK